MNIHRKEFSRRAQRFSLEQYTRWLTRHFSSLQFRSSESSRQCETPSKNIFVYEPIATCQSNSAYHMFVEHVRNTIVRQDTVHNLMDSPSSISMFDTIVHHSCRRSRRDDCNVAVDRCNVSMAVE
jgi:hypothetical protein